MYDIAVAVAACLRAGTRVDVAWVVDSDLEPAPDLGEAVALTPGGGRIGGLLDGALDDRLVDARTGRLLDLVLSPLEAAAAGRRGTRASCLLISADTLPADLWRRLVAREPICLLTRLDGDRVIATTSYDVTPDGPGGEAATDLIARGTSGRVRTEDGVLTVLCPLPRLAVLGAGPVVDALATLAGLLGWSVQASPDVITVAGLAATLTAQDLVVVASHDLDAAGTVLAEALDGDAGYIGSVGSRRMQEARTRWLADRGVTDLSRVHAPAGLDIGAATPAEIALSVAAEAVAVRSARTRK